MCWRGGVSGVFGNDNHCQLLSCLLRWAPFLIPFGSNLGSKRAPQKDSPFGHPFSRRELKEAGSKSGNNHDSEEDRGESTI